MLVVNWLIDAIEPDHQSPAQTRRAFGIMSFDREHVRAAVQQCGDIGVAEVGGVAGFIAVNDKSS